MKVIAGKNAILYNVSFEDVDEAIVFDNTSSFGCGKMSLRTRFATWLFRFIMSGKRGSIARVVGCSFTSTDELLEEHKKALDSFLNNSSGTPLHRILEA